MSTPTPHHTPFIGRERELAALDERLAAARQGDGGIVLIVGDAGIGKTRLTSELTDRARERGWTVLFGSAVQADGMPPYLPFIEALRAHVRATSPDILRAQLGDGASDIALLMREVRALFPDLPDTPAPDRYRLFESITDMLLAVARGVGCWVLGVGREPNSPQHPTPNTQHPGLLLVLDDLHWADAPSLQLLLHVARRIRAAPVLVAGTLRDAEVDRRHPLAAVRAELVREQAGDEIVLGGLAAQDVVRFIELSTGTAPSPSLAGVVYRETEGNPLFVVELVRLLAAEGRLSRPDAPTSGRLSVPRSVQQVIGRRLDRLSSECNRALTLAAVIGREFDLIALQRATVRDREPVQGDALFDALEEAEGARVIAALSETPGRFTFTHPLIRETLYGQILTSTRVRLHRQVGEAVEEAYSGNPDAHLAELALHFFQAAPAGDAAKAVAYARRAGDRAMALFAYEDAEALYQTALRAVALEPAGDDFAQCGLLLSLAEAQQRSGDTTAAKDTFLRCVGLARRLGAAEQLAWAALGYGGYRFTPGVVDATLVGLLEESLELLRHELAALRARVLARLAMELYHGGARERRDALSREAVETARRSSDPAAMAAALVGRHYAVHEPENLDERVAAATELVHLAEAGGDREIALQGYYLLSIDQLERGDPDALDSAIAAHARIAGEIRQPLYLWRTDLLRAMRAGQQGRFADARQLATRAFEIGQKAQIVNTLQAYGTQMLVLCYEAGGLERIEGQVRQLTDAYPLLPAYRAGLALLYVRLGQEDQARIEFERLAEYGFDAMPRDENWVSAMTCLAETCAYLDDADRAAQLYDLLLPFEGRCNAVNAAVGSLSAVGRYLGLLATTLGNWDAAAPHFEHALALHERLGATPWVARTRLDLATMLNRRADPADRERAVQLAGEALSTAKELGMVYLAVSATALLERLGATSAQLDDHRGPALPDGLTTREVEVLRLVAAGRTNREIAGDLVLSVRTVDHHIAAIYRKTHARRRADAAAYAVTHGLAQAADLER